MMYMCWWVAMKNYKVEQFFPNIEGCQNIFFGGGGAVDLKNRVSYKKALKKFVVYVYWVIAGSLEDQVG